MCFSCEERVVCDIYNYNKVKIRKIREKRGKIRKTWSMSKNRSSEKFAAKMGIFMKKNVILVREKCFRLPQTRRQVSATLCVNTFSYFLFH